MSAGQKANVAAGGPNQVAEVGQFILPNSLKRIARGRTWLHKWWRRYEKGGRAGLESRSRQPELSPQAHDEKVRGVVLRLRRTFERRCVGLIGAQAIQNEIRRQRLLPTIPSLASINRWLKEAGLIKGAPVEPKRVYYPAPLLKPAHVTGHPVICPVGKRSLLFIRSRRRRVPLSRRFAPTRQRSVCAPICCKFGSG
jgi:hypothetical protein